jgi:hypothetical protein
VGIQNDKAQAEWDKAHFKTTVQYATTGKWKIGRQDIVNNTVAYCDTTVITVSPS